MLTILGITENQKKILIDFLEDYDQRLSNDGCNDLYLDNTEENRLMVNEAWVWNCGGLNQEALDWIHSYKKYEQLDTFGQPVHKQIVVNNGIIFEYLRARLGLNK